MTTHQTRSRLERPTKGARSGLLRLVLDLDTVTTAALGVLSLAAEGASPVARGTDFAVLLRRRAPPA